MGYSEWKARYDAAPGAILSEKEDGHWPPIWSYADDGERLSFRMTGASEAEVRARLDAMKPAGGWDEKVEIAPAQAAADLGHWCGDMSVTVKPAWRWS